MLRKKVLEFLYDQVNQGKIPHIRKGMVEDLEVFVTSVLEEQQVKQVSDRMLDQTAKESPEKEEK